ncbi:PPOX class probable F420-dependent enzyme [Haloactinopolyspora alba]|uniref:PPOX class probable F420-dependent enzyme n=1 Tax=Haloactinopolyspora alba TaxID=648780 RepID=A0A2P8E164_9ACTN|nr:TIGR03618 family F420-dependent PPOX class oxidoreductase [Haloactinopolyspora alba]PSL03210.1 PPOX class probable F420-dependent enzyme [Haloactinopolyspora alba]
MTNNGYGPGTGPPPRRPSEDELVNMVATAGSGVLAVNTPDGHPHLSTMLYTWDPAERIARFSTTAKRLKTRHLRRDPRSALHVYGSGLFAFATAEGTAELSDVSTEPGDAAGRELLASTSMPVDPGDEDAFLRQMVADERLVIRLRVTRLYGVVFDELVQ